MTLIIWLPLLVAIIGLVLYLAIPGGKVCEIGKIMFFCGLLAWLLVAGAGHVRI